MSLPGQRPASGVRWRPDGGGSSKHGDVGTVAVTADAAWRSAIVTTYQYQTQAWTERTRRMLELWAERPLPKRLPIGKRAAAGGQGQPPAASAMSDPPTRYIASTAIQKAVFAQGKIDGVAVSFLVDTGSAVTVVYIAAFGSEGKVQDARLETCEQPPMLAANSEPQSILGESECQVQLAGAVFVHSVLVRGRKP